MRGWRPAGGDAGPGAGAGARAGARTRVGAAGRHHDTTLSEAEGRRAQVPPWPFDINEVERKLTRLQRRGAVSPVDAPATPRPAAAPAAASRPTAAAPKPAAAPPSIAERFLRGCRDPTIRMKCRVVAALEPYRSAATIFTAAGEREYRELKERVEAMAESAASETKQTPTFKSRDNASRSATSAPAPTPAPAGDASRGRPVPRSPAAAAATAKARKAPVGDLEVDWPSSSASGSSTDDGASSDAEPRISGLGRLPGRKQGVQTSSWSRPPAKSKVKPNAKEKVKVKDNDVQGMSIFQRRALSRLAAAK